MIVILVSKSEKKAKKKVRQVIDMFADRIGDDCWKTNITQEGLLTLKHELCHIASKNMAVSCHWIHKKRTTELLWIIGSKRKFTNTGIVPIASTKKNLTHIEWETTDLILPVLKPLVALTALFHDVGKSSEGFQKMLKGEVDSDVIRHEWISLLIFSEIADKKDDKELLEALANNSKVFKEIETKIKKDGVDFNIKSKKLSKLALIIGILIVSHHKTPSLISDFDNCKSEEFDNIEYIFEFIDFNWGYKKVRENNYLNSFKFDYIFSEKIRKEISRYSLKLLDNLNLFYNLLENNGMRSLIYRAKLSINLGDYLYSSKFDDSIKDKNKLFANTNYNNELNQTLENHLLGVESLALQSIYTIKRLSNNLPVISQHKDLKKSSSINSKYYWQDKAVNVIKRNLTDKEQGFFCVNYASTGTGKTLANAKIIYAANSKFDSLRLNVALGLRTLTLQTGDSFRNKLHFDSSEMAVVVGSKAVIDLQKANDNNFDNDKINNELQEDFFIDEIEFDNYINYPEIQKIIKSKKDETFLCAPVVASTIDYLIPATESTKGSKWIIPFIRLMNSDIIIDEIDDFVGKDLISISRLVHLAGMLGRKVLISSATITPSISLGFFKAYSKGYQVYSKTNLKDNEINCLFVDEFRSKFLNIKMQNNIEGISQYVDFYKNQMAKRIKSLYELEQKNGVKRKGKIINIGNTELRDINNYYLTIYKSIFDIHKNNYVVDEHSKKPISFGLIRFANIDKCVGFTKFINEQEENDGKQIYTICYHSLQLLLVRNEIEKFLDDTLKRSEESSQNICIQNNRLRNIIDGNNEAKEFIFLVISTPIEEVGRDHDFDWAIIEPSSIRSIIQLSGRVLRHREKYVKKPNVYILEENLKSYCLNNNDISFTCPGYETKTNRLSNHNLNNILDINMFEESINSATRLSSEYNDKNELVKIEHDSIYKTLLDNKAGPEFAIDWYDSYWYLTGIPQKINGFRENNNNTRFYCIYDEEKETFSFCEKDGFGNFIEIEDSYKFRIINNNYKYNILQKSLYEIVEKMSKIFNLSIKEICKRYNYVDLPNYFLKSNSRKFYQVSLGFYKEKKEENNG
jgi:CRISPR-associated endonuclease/helicase Cas3